MNKNYYFKNIPKVDTLLKEERIQALCRIYGKGSVTEAIREELDHLRALVRTGTEEEITDEFERFTEELPGKIEEASRFPLRKVINATGIILHTNLGRAPLGNLQGEALFQTMGGYTNLEYDTETGKRGKRWEHYADLIASVTGAEGAAAVNNNAAAVTLMLSALTKGKEVIVSRGELIEIGGHFRIPEVMEQSGARLREVGTTNRTRISDYEEAITEETGALLKVHTSNYKIIGFTEETSIEELVELGEKYHLPVLVDAGSGVLVNLEQFGLAHEPTVQEMLKKGADIVTFSGDKLLGGPQAGIITGKQKYINEMLKHPLMRALRLDKCTIAALTATFREYLNENNAIEHIPVLWMLSRKSDELKQQAQELCAALKNTGVSGEFAVEPSISMMGGGSLPAEEIPSFAVTIKPAGMSCDEMAERMRKMSVPVIAYTKNGRVWFDMRTVTAGEVHELKCELTMLLGESFSGERVWESNPPRTRLTPNTGFEDQGAHQLPNHAHITY